MYWKYHLQHKSKVRGELEGLKAIINTKTVTISHPLVEGQLENGLDIIMYDYFSNLTALNASSWPILGRSLADLHLYNLRKGSSSVYPHYFLDFFSNY